MSVFSKRIIICGTDTDVGKTIVSSLFVQGLKGIYWKPVQSGTENGTDTKTVCNLLNLEHNRYLSERYKFKAPVSPHWAAEQESSFIEPSNLKLPELDELIIIETAGGLMVPLNRDWLQIDQLKVWGAPIILVARSGLGTLNHTLLSLEALKRSILYNKIEIIKQTAKKATSLLKPMIKVGAQSSQKKQLSVSDWRHLLSFWPISNKDNQVSLSWSIQFLLIKR
jgi:dethiobiotin synthase